MNYSYLDAYPDVPVCLGDQLIRCSTLFSEKTAVTDPHYSLTWSQLLVAADLIANDLLTKNIQTGDRVIVAMERRYDIVPVYLAIARVGAVSVPFNFKASEEEQQKIIQLTQPVGAFYHTDIHLDLNSAGYKGWSCPLNRDTVNQMLAGLSDTDVKQDSLKLPLVAPDNPAYLNITSGSTGDPKAAVATHRQLYANTRACVEKFKLHENDVHLPLFAVMAHPHEIFCRSLFTGASIVLLENLYPRTIVDTIEKYRVT